MLQKRGHQVVGLDSDLFRRCTFGDPKTIADVPNIRKDIRDVDAKDVQGFDACLHLAGLSNDPLGDFNPQLTYDINHLASVKLAELCKKAGVNRWVFSSSCSNYGAGGDGLLDEQAAFNVCASKENYRIRELAEIVKETVPNSKVEFAGGAGPDKRNYRVSGDKFAKAFPDMVPTWTAKAAAKDLYETFKKHQLTPND